MKKRLFYFAASLLFYGCSKTTVSQSGPLIGKPVPEFIVQKWITAEPDKAEKFMLIEFWATWCPPCVAMISELNDIHERFKDRMVVIGISSEDEETVQSFTQRNIDYFVAIDTQTHMQRKLGVHYIPYAIVVDPAGIIRWAGNPKAKGTKLTPIELEQIIRDYGRISGNEVQKKAQNSALSGFPTSVSNRRQSIKEFFGYLICDSSTMDDYLAAPYTHNLFSKIEKDLSRFGLQKSDIVKVMNGDVSVVIHFQESVIDAVLVRCGSKYSRKQLRHFLRDVQLSPGIYQRQETEKNIKKRHRVPQGRTMTWIVNSMIAVFFIFVLLIVSDQITNFLPEIRAFRTPIFFAGFVLIGLKYLHDHTGLVLLLLLMPLALIPIVWILIRESVRKEFSKRFGRPSAQDQWICRECGEVNHVINRVCHACHKPK